ncbi:MAG: hypothetical protein R3C11_03010 [Planctomycetaceae bacterium]
MNNLRQFLSQRMTRPEVVVNRDDISVNPTDSGLLLYWAWFYKPDEQRREQLENSKQITGAVFVTLAIIFAIGFLNQFNQVPDTLWEWAFILLVLTVFFGLVYKIYSIAECYLNIQAGNLPVYAWEIDLTHQQLNSSVTELLVREEQTILTAAIEKLAIDENHQVIAHTPAREIQLTTSLDAETAVWLVDKLNGLLGEN